MAEVIMVWVFLLVWIGLLSILGFASWMTKAIIQYRKDTFYAINQQKSETDYWKTKYERERDRALGTGSPKRNSPIHSTGMGLGRTIRTFL